MAHVKIHKTSFSGGEVSPSLLGRSDLIAYENGAKQLRNVIVRPTGSVERRPGLRYVDSIEGPGRLIAFEFNTAQVYLLVFLNHALHIYESGVRISTLTTPWSESQIDQLHWTQSADTLLVAHPDVPPKRLIRTRTGAWQLSNWTFASSDNGRLFIPHYKFSGEDVQVARSGASGTIVLTATDFIFHPDHRHGRFRFENREVIIDNVENAGGNQENGWYDKALVTVVESLSGSSTTTRDWSEQVFSALRGWPISLTFHQDRLVIGGSRSLPNTLWLSKSSDLFNFDQGDGLDDESIEFSILSDQVNAIRSVFSGRHLQVFTSGAEWMVTGNPLTPTSIQLFRQTRIGSPIDRVVPPTDIDGATIFIPRNDKQIREFIFADVEQAYQAPDLALVSDHLINRPVDMDYDQLTRILHVVMSDGSLGTLTVYRTEQITAWTLYETAGKFLRVAIVGSDAYVLVKRKKKYLIEVFDSSLFVDSGLSGFAEEAVSNWGNLEHLEEETVFVLADYAVRPAANVINGEIFLDEPARSLQVGLPFAHVIEPLPPHLPSGANGVQGQKLRPIAITFRLHDTSALTLDIGNGLINVPLTRLGRQEFDRSPVPFSGDKKFRTLGWQQDGANSVWRIQQDIPLPFKLLSVTTEISINE
jgi:hypothetical protein